MDARDAAAIIGAVVFWGSAVAALVALLVLRFRHGIQTLGGAQPGGAGEPLGRAVLLFGAAAAVLGSVYLVSASSFAQGFARVSETNVLVRVAAWGRLAGFGVAFPLWSYAVGMYLRRPVFHNVAASVLLAVAVLGLVWASFFVDGEWIVATGAFVVYSYYLILHFTAFDDADDFRLYARVGLLLVSVARAVAIVASSSLTAALQSITAEIWVELALDVVLYMYGAGFALYGFTIDYTEAAKDSDDGVPATHNTVRPARPAGRSMLSSSLGRRRRKT